MLGFIVFCIIILIIHTATRDWRIKYSLVKQGWVLYSKEGCYWCTKQHDTLGGYSETTWCDGTAPCGPDVKLFPTWVNKHSGVKVVGFQTMDNLEKLLV